MLTLARKASSSALQLVKGSKNNDERVFEFKDTENHTYLYKLKNGILKVYRNNQKLGQVTRFNFHEASYELSDGYSDMPLPRVQGFHRILPEMATLARGAGIRGLENYVSTAEVRSQPGRVWRVATTRGLYVRRMFCTQGRIMEVIPYRSVVVEIEAKKIADELWIRHQDGWSLASKNNPDGSMRVLMRVEDRQPAERKTENRKTKSRISRSSSTKSIRTQNSMSSTKRSASKFNSMSNLTQGSYQEGPRDIFLQLALRRRRESEACA